MPPFRPHGMRVENGLVASFWVVATREGPGRGAFAGYSKQRRYIAQSLLKCLRPRLSTVWGGWQRAGMAAQPGERSEDRRALGGAEAAEATCGTGAVVTIKRRA